MFNAGSTDDAHMPRWNHQNAEALGAAVNYFALPVNARATVSMKDLVVLWVENLGEEDATFIVTLGIRR